MPVLSFIRYDNQAAAVPAPADPNPPGLGCGSERPGKRPGIKKLSPELRKEKPSYKSEPVPYRRMLLRLKEDTQFQRSTIQVAFLLLCIWIGIEFTFFVRW